MSLCSLDSPPRKSAEVGQKHAATEPLREQMRLAIVCGVVVTDCLDLLHRNHEMSKNMLKKQTCV